MLIQFVQNSGVAAGLIVVILLLRRVRRLPSGCLDALWIAALVRLFIPVNLPSPFSIYRLLAHAPQPDTLSTSLTQSTVFAVNPLSPMSIFGVVWAIGTAFALTHLALSYLRLLHICRNAQPVCDPSILQAVQNAGLRRPVSVRTHPSITVPCTFGIIRPVILLPVDLEVQEDASIPYLLAHELAHIRRLDCLRKLLFQVVRCVHWFNPLVCLMCRAAGRDLERACDTTVLDTLSDDQRAAYAGALLNLARAPHTAPLYSTFGTSDLEERIYSIMTFKKRSMISVLMTAAVVMTTTSAFATNVPEQNQAAVCQTATVVANSEISKIADDDRITLTITSVDASTNPIDVENSLDVVSRETLPDGSIRLTLKDGSEVIAIKAVPSTEATAE